MVPKFNKEIGQNCLYLHLFLEQEQEFAGNLNLERLARNKWGTESESESVLYKISKNFTDFFSVLKNEAGNAKEYVFVASGGREFLKSISSIKHLSSLSRQKKIWLCHNNENLTNLINNKKLRAVYKNNELMEKINMALQGDVEMLSDLMSNEQLAELIDDEEVHKSIKKLDLSAMRDQVVKRFPESN
jgi:hypothetical protein